MPKPTIVDFNTIFNANIIQPLCDLAWDVFGHPTEDRPVNTADEARELLLNSVYPIGSIYFCAAATDPNGVLPGTWTLLTAGQFLVSAGGTGDYARGSTGGAAQVTLTEAELPGHRHAAPFSGKFVVNRFPTGTNYSIIETPGAGYVDANNADYTEFTGGTQPHENRPPYLAVNMWQRTA